MEKIFDLIEQERQRQENEICLIASENYMSENVIKACGSVLINKYAEGYSGHRYYSGCHIIDEIETIAIENAKKLFKCNFANVQPNSGCQANQAAYLAFLKPGDCVLGMGVNEGGHISHSLSIGFAGTFYNVIPYGLTDDGLLDYDSVKEKIYANNPKLLIVGASAYPREIDFKRIREIVDEYNNTIFKQDGNENRKCYMMVDIAHIAGLVATGLHQSPIPYADVVTSTVQKTLRSGRGGLILWNNPDYTKKINSAIFPRLQGGPLENMIAGKAIGFEEALQPSFKEYQLQVLKNIKAMEKVFKNNKINMVSGGSDNHLILLDLRNNDMSGQELEDVLQSIGIITNKNAVKDDPRSKMQTSGLRIGTAAATTRGASEEDCSKIAEIISNVIIEFSKNKTLSKETIEKDSLWVKNWCKTHPIYK